MPPVSKKFKGKFYDNDQDRKNFIIDAVKIINNYYLKTNQDDKILDVTECIEKSNKSKNHYLKANKFFDDQVKYEEYAKTLEKRYKYVMPKGFRRHYCFGLIMPKEGQSQAEKDEIEKKNMEYINNLCNEDKIKENSRDMLMMIYKADKTKFFETDFDKVMDELNENRYLYETGFVVSTIYTNNNLMPNSDFKETFDYNNLMMECTSNLKSKVLINSNPFFTFLPEDLPIIDFYNVHKELIDLCRKYPDIIDHQTEVPEYENSLGEKDLYAKYDEPLKQFLQEHDQNHDFFFKYNIGGKTFFEQFKHCIDTGEEIKIYESPKLANGLKRKDFNSEFKTFLDQQQVINDSINDINTNKLIGPKKESRIKIINDFIKKGKFDDTYSMQKLVAYYDACKALPDNNDSKNIVSKVDKLISSGIIRRDIFYSFDSMINERMPLEYIKSCNVTNGVIYESDCPNAVKFEHESNKVNNCSVEDIISIYDNHNYKNQFNNKKEESILMANRLENSYNSRTFFGKWLRPQAWKEFRIMNQIKREAIASGISSVDYGKMMKTTSNKELGNLITDKIVVVEYTKEDTVSLISVSELDQELILNPKDPKIANDYVRERQKENNIEIKQEELNNNILS